MKIVIVRHGQTRGNILNEQGISLFTGTLNNQDTDLTEKGIEDAKKLANNEIIKSIQKVYCSDLNRAIDTAKLAKPGYELNIDKRLRERSLGDFEGNYPEDLIKNEEYKKYFTDNEYKKFRTDFIQKAPNGENYTDIIKRTKIFLDSSNLIFLHPVIDKKANNKVIKINNFFINFLLKSIVYKKQKSV